MEDSQNTAKLTVPINHSVSNGFADQKNQNITQVTTSKCVLMQCDCYGG